MKKELWILIILALIIVILGGIVLWPATKDKNNGSQNSQQQKQGQRTEGIKIDYPQENGQVSSPLKIAGSVNGGGWSGFEGQVGTVQLLDYKGNKLAQGVLTATTDWTKPPVNFETTLMFSIKTPGPATLFFSNENPSGDQAKDKKFGLSVNIILQP